jgi:hypothetical protein
VARWVFPNWNLNFTHSEVIPVVGPPAWASKNPEIPNGGSWLDWPELQNIRPIPAQSTLSDAALIVNGNFVEHYEIALYGSLASFARRLRLQNAASLLEETLAEEKKKADAKLTEIGEALVNLDAARGQSARGCLRHKITGRRTD